MRLDTRPVYIPAMKYRGQLFPLKTKIMLLALFVLLVVFGAQLIRGYFGVVIWTGHHAVDLMQFLHLA